MEATKESEERKETKMSKALRIMLVYQVGIANVFRVTSFNLADYGRNAVRLKQSDFRTCESFSLDMAAAGAIVRSAQCNQAGDIARAQWSETLGDAPFSESQHPVKAN